MFTMWPLELGLGTHNPRFVVWPLELGVGSGNPSFVAWPLELGLGIRNPIHTLLCGPLSWRRRGGGRRKDGPSRAARVLPPPASSGGGWDKGHCPMHAGTGWADTFLTPARNSTRRSDRASPPCA